VIDRQYMTQEDLFRELQMIISTMTDETLSLDFRENPFFIPDGGLVEGRFPRENGKSVCLSAIVTYNDFYDSCSKKSRFDGGNKR
jgi:hypothetical protein